MKADVYRNLNKNCFSLRSRHREDYGKVRHHADIVYMSDVEFIVQPYGRKKMKKESQKNVHAFARGWVNQMWDMDSYIRIPIEFLHIIAKGKSVTYDSNYPYFYRINTKPSVKVEKADLAICYKNRVYIS